MLKSTYKGATPRPLPIGWTEHKAPSGHSYYYNAETKQSTYTRPAPVDLPVSLSLTGPSESLLKTTSELKLPSPFTAQQDKFQKFQAESLAKESKGNHFKAKVSRLQPSDKPRSTQSIPGHENWLLVHTKYDRRFVYNTEKDQSFWRIPDKLKNGILALDQSRIREKANILKNSISKLNEEPVNSPNSTFNNASNHETVGHELSEDAEDEELEVTDDEATDDSVSKPQENEDKICDPPLEFDENDIAYQLAAMGEEYGLEPDEYGGGIDFDNGADLLNEDSATLFKDLLNDFRINPYSPWEKILDEGRLIDDIRYTALPSMKLRKKVWEDWSRNEIKNLQEVRAKQEKKDPRIPYLTFLQKHATPKLYWPEFKRKYRKDNEMRDTAMTDKDREKIYREHISRLKFPQGSLKSDLSTLLREQPLSSLNNATLPSHLPPKVLTDVRFISLDPVIRDPLIEAYISTLPSPPENIGEEETEKSAKDKINRERRLKALEDREKSVAEEKSRQRINLEVGKGMLREEEEKIAKALDINQRGLTSQLVNIESRL